MTWGVRQADKLLPGSNWTLGFIFRANWGETARNMPISSILLLGGSQSSHVEMKSQNLRQHLGKHTVIALPGRNGEVEIFAYSICA